MRLIRAVSQTQLPVIIGLPPDRIDHLLKEVLGGIVERHKNGYKRSVLEFTVLLHLPSCSIREALGSVVLLGLRLSDLI